MGERRKTKAIKGGEFHLPEPVIHRIQCFLTGKEAAQTTILSKPWHSAWLSRPTLDFDEGDFPRTNDEFLKFVKMTIQRYEQSNLKIEGLRLRISRPYAFSDGSNNPANDLIVRALKTSATHISFQTQSPTNSDLPQEVFESGNLVELSAEGCKIDLQMDQKVICSKLESLCLSEVRIKSDQILEKIISSCPLIQKLSLYDVTDFQNRKVSIDFPKLHELRCLVLNRVQFDNLLLADLSSKFPSLEDLTLKYIGNFREICSRSLKRLTIVGRNDDIFKAEFDVPNIHKFTFRGSSDFPSMLSFKSTSREWESHVSTAFYKPLSTLWFNGLKRILTQLSSSKIHLSLNFFAGKSFNYEEPGDIHGLPKPQVENVTMHFFYIPSSSCYSLFDGLFRLCRPKWITHIFHFGNTNNKFLCEILVFMHGLHDLKEAEMELYDENIAAWRSMPLESLMLDGSIKQNVRFQLKWKQ